MSINDLAKEINTRIDNKELTGIETDIYKVFDHHLEQGQLDEARTCIKVVEWAYSLLKSCSPDQKIELENNKVKLFIHTGEEKEAFLSLIEIGKIHKGLNDEMYEAHLEKCFDFFHNMKTPDFYDLLFLYTEKFYLYKKHNRSNALSILHEMIETKTKHDLAISFWDYNRLLQLEKNTDTKNLIIENISILLNEKIPPLDIMEFSSLLSIKNFIKEDNQPTNKYLLSKIDALIGRPDNKWLDFMIK